MRGIIRVTPPPITNTPDALIGAYSRKLPRSAYAPPTRGRGRQLSGRQSVATMRNYHHSSVRDGLRPSSNSAKGGIAYLS